MGVEGETIIEEDTQITGGVGARDVISTDSNGGRYMFIAKFGTNEQEFCFAVVQFKLIEGHPASDIINAGLQPRKRLRNTLCYRLVTRKIEL